MATAAAAFRSMRGLMPEIRRSRRSKKAHAKHATEMHQSTICRKRSGSSGISEKEGNTVSSRIFSILKKERPSRVSTVTHEDSSSSVIRCFVRP